MRYKDNITKLLLKQGFYSLLKSCKDLIQGVLETMKENDKIKYLPNF